jgi:hypothetical protein
MVCLACGSSLAVVCTVSGCPNASSAFLTGIG